MSNSITSNPKDHVFYFVFYLPGTEDCSFAMLKHCLKCLRAREDVKMFTSKEEWDAYGEGAKIGEIALEIVMEHDDVDDACAQAVLHVESLIWRWAHTSEPSADGFWIVVYTGDSDDEIDSEGQEHVDEFDADLEACTQSLRLTKLNTFSEDLDSAMSALDDWNMGEK